MAHPIRRSITWLEKNRFAVAQMLVLVALAIYPQVAHAYMGQQIIEFTANRIVGPIALFLIIITIGAAMVKPDMAKTAGYVALVAVVLLALMKGGGAVLDSLNSTTAVTR